MIREELNRHGRLGLPRGGLAVDIPAPLPCYRKSNMTLRLVKTAMNERVEGRRNNAWERLVTPVIEMARLTGDVRGSFVSPGPDRVFSTWQACLEVTLTSTTLQKRISKYCLLESWKHLLGGRASSRAVGVRCFTAFVVKHLNRVFTC
jgi:hypothetical protein